VALKTAGLLALMAQAGLRIPACRGSRLPGFPIGVRRHRRRAVDRGEPQHLLGAHRTTSRRWIAVSTCRRSSARRSRFRHRSDEGGALGVAIVDHFRHARRDGVATSHYDALKTYASTTDGVATAAFGFDRRRSRRPTRSSTDPRAAAWPWRSPARSARTRRLSLRRAQNSARAKAQLAEHLARSTSDMRALEHEQRLAAQRTRGR
jgi:DNA mismatch repair protein MutS2